MNLPWPLNYPFHSSMLIVQTTCLLFFFRAQKTLKAAVESHADVATENRNPFQQRPSSSRAASVAAASLEKAMAELDDDQHMPDGVNYDTWRKLVAIRRIKVEKEQQVDLTYRSQQLKLVSVSLRFFI